MGTTTLAERAGRVLREHGSLMLDTGFDYAMAPDRADAMVMETGIGYTIICTCGAELPTPAHGAFWNRCRCGQTFEREVGA